MTIALILLLTVFAGYFLHFSLKLARAQDIVVLHLHGDIKDRSTD